MKLSNKVYDRLKWACLVVLPAVGTLYTALAVIWGFPCGEEVAGTILALETFAGALLGISTANYNKNK